MKPADIPGSLPDILAPHLSLVFCGINPGMRAVATGHHFEGRGNRFWRVLHLAGFTPTQIAPEHDRTILQFGLGLTAVVPRATVSAAELSRAEIQNAADSFTQKIEHYAPQNIAFLGKMAFAALCGKREIEWGRQALPFGGAHVWVLPNPSGLNRSFSLDALVSAYQEVRLALALPR
ncbi:TDG/mug DNA glycosylase family protein [Paraburkholderia sp. GAS199]|uniref:G/U mismatch-specific DNA glycosylase n=1 Tax=Paraburkholderia sp. GAS199 TaxID=3035126 RepID=UPI003D1EA932